MVKLWIVALGKLGQRRKKQKYYFAKTFAIYNNALLPGFQSSINFRTIKTIVQKV